MSLKFVCKVPMNHTPALVQIMAWRRPGNKPLSEPMVVRLRTHICVTQPQWVNSVRGIGCLLCDSTQAPSACRRALMRLIESGIGGILHGPCLLILNSLSPGACQGEIRWINFVHWDHLKTRKVPTDSYKLPYFTATVLRYHVYSHKRSPHIWDHFEKWSL